MNQEYNPKIYVLHLREIIYTAVFVVLTVILIMVMVSMFTNDKDISQDAAANITPTAYSYDYR